MELIKPQACPHSGSQRWAELRGEQAIGQSQRAAGQEAECSRVTLRNIDMYTNTWQNFTLTLPVTAGMQVTGEKQRH